MISRLRLLGAFVIAMAMIFAVFLTACATKAKGDKAPDFKLETLDGKTVSLDDIRKDPDRKGKTRVLLIDFWATWCPPCMETIPHLQKLQEKYEKKGFTVVGIALQSKVDKIKDIKKDKKLTYPLLVDSKGTCARDYKVRYLPTTYIIDKEGKISAVHEGYTKGLEKKLENEITELLK